ncbi:MAG: hypothetical protein LBO66_12060 [Deltaproteobacteria bacterium]|jgi:hypothetical protein|nr:hypothetical protein [Deltaproteobacteria bacterium]
MTVSPIFDTAGGQAFIREIVENLSLGNNVVAVVPDQFRTRAFMEKIQTALLHSAGPGLVFYDVSAPLRASIQRGNAKKGGAARAAVGPESLRALLEASDSHGAAGPSAKAEDYFKIQEGDYFRVRGFWGFEAWSQENQARAAKDLDAIATLISRESKNMTQKAGWRYLAMVSPTFPAQRHNAGQAIVEWWGSTRPSDHDYLFETFIDRYKPDVEPATHYWLKSLALAVGGDDPDLIASIVREEPLDLPGVKKILEAHPLSAKKLDLAKLGFNWHFRDISPNAGFPPASPMERELWARGYLAPHRFGFWHPSVLAYDEDLLRKTIYRGQREVFFPLVDQVHGAVCQYVESRLGRGVWHVGGDESANNNSMPQDEIGPLFFFLSNLSGEKLGPLSQARNELVALCLSWRWIRIAAAHGELVPFQLLKEAIDKYAAARARVLFPEESPRAFKADSKRFVPPPKPQVASNPNFRPLPPARGAQAASPRSVATGRETLAAPALFALDKKFGKSAKR